MLAQARLKKIFMLITFHCDKCQAELEADAGMAGAEVKCPQCGKVMLAPRQSLGPGVTVGGFEIIRMLGEGGMGEVYLAKQLSLNRNVALKILPAQMKMRRGVTERFFKEVQLLARLDHANIVMAFEAGEDSGVFYLAMGYVKGESLDQKLRREGPLEEDVALQMAGKLAGALDYAWREHKLLHRDIKPANIMLTDSGEIKLMDFGLAKCLAEDVSLTVSGAVIGTPNYMSPEQVEGRSELDCRADIYSLGATVYHMVTGKLPFAGSSIMETLRRQVNEMLPDPRTVNPAVSENCVTLLEIMLSKNRDQRHQDYKALGGDIDRVRAGQPPMCEPLEAGASVMLRAGAPGLSVSSRPPPRGGKTFKPGRKAILASAGSALLLGIFALVVTGLFSRRADLAEERGRPPEISGPAAAPAQAAPGPLPANAGQDEKKSRLTRQYIEALSFMREHPADFAGALLLLEPLVKDAAGTDLEAKIADDVRRVGHLRQQAVERFLGSLKNSVQARASAGDYEGALRLIEQEAGPLAGDTKEARAEMAREVQALRKAAEELKARQAAEEELAKKAALGKEKMAELAGGMAADLIKGDAAALNQRVSVARSDPALEGAAQDINALNDMARQALAWPERVAAAFEENKGKTLEVEFKNGRKEKLAITGVEGERVRAQRQMDKGFIGRDFLVNDLSLAEKIRRIGDDPRPVTKIMRGLAIVRGGGDWAAAENEFNSVSGPLAEALAAESPARKARHSQAAVAKPEPVAAAVPPAASPVAVHEEMPPLPDQPGGQRPPGLREMGARRLLHTMIRQTGVAWNMANLRATADEILQKDIPPEDIARIREMMGEFDRHFAQTRVAQECAFILEALRSKASPAPAVSHQEPARFSPVTEETMRATMARLEASNGGRVMWKCQSTMEGMDLEILNSPNLRDLKPLVGLPLTRLALVNTSVDDLRPLAELPLVHLQIVNATVASIKPVSSISTLKSLHFVNLGISDLAPLRGLQLKEFESSDEKSPKTGVRDIAPLADMPLEKLTIQFSSAVTPAEMAANAAILHALQVGELTLRGHGVRDLKFMENMPAVKRLYVEDTMVADLSPLRDLKGLSHLRLKRNQNIADLEGVKGMELHIVQLVDMDIRSLEPLAWKGNRINNMMIVSCQKLADTDSIPEYFPRLKTINIDNTFPRPEILLRCAKLEQVIFGYPGQPLTMDQFRQRFGKQPRQPARK